jgi:hypothetical protein
MNRQPNVVQKITPNWLWKNHLDYLDDDEYVGIFTGSICGPKGRMMSFNGIHGFANALKKQWPLRLYFYDCNSKHYVINFTLDELRSDEKGMRTYAVRCESQHPTMKGWLLQVDASHDPHFEDPINAPTHWGIFYRHM